MGSFLGHVFTGIVFVYLGIWHNTQLCSGYFKSRQVNGAKFKSRTYFATDSGRPLDCWVKVLALAITIAGEVIFAFKDGRFFHMANSQHIAMYVTFEICFVVELLEFYKFSLPPHCCHMAYLVAFGIEATLFYWHLHNREPMDVQIHLLLVCVIATTVVVVVIEMTNRSAVTPALVRSYCLLLQGVWLCQAGFILYPPFHMQKWDLGSHNEMMLVAVAFGGWMAFCLVATIGIWMAVAWRYGEIRKPQTSQFAYQKLAMDQNEEGSENGTLQSLRCGLPEVVAEKRTVV